MNEAHTFHINPESELARALADAEGTIVLLNSNGRRFRVIPADEDITAGYTPDANKVREVVAETIGSWADLAIDQLGADVAEARRAGSRPPDRH